MSIEALTWAYKQPIKNSATKFILVTLSNYADSTNFCWSSIKNLSRKTSISESTVKRALAWLTENGFLHRRQARYNAKGRFLSNEYVIQCPIEDPESPGVTMTPGLDSNSKSRGHGDLRSNDSSPGVMVTPHTKEEDKSSESKDSSDKQKKKKSMQQAELFEPEAEPELAVKAPRQHRPLMQRDWWPSPEDFDHAVRGNPLIDVKAQTKQFVDKMLSKGTRSADWTAEWRYWIRCGTENVKKYLTPDQQRIKVLEKAAKAAADNGATPSGVLALEYLSLTGGKSL